MAALGHVTATTFSPSLGHPIALALLADADRRSGETVYAVAPLSATVVPVRVCAPVFIDPQGARARG